MFLGECRELGVTPIFAMDDLMLGQRPDLVARTLLGFAKKCLEEQYDVPVPPAVQ